MSVCIDFKADGDLLVAEDEEQHVSISKKIKYASKLEKIPEENKLIQQQKENKSDYHQLIEEEKHS